MSLLKAIEDERAKLITKIEELQNQKAVIDTQIDEVKAELRAIDAYTNAKQPKVKKTVTRKPRGAGLRQQILDLLKTKPHGLGRSAIIDELGVRGDKGKEQSVSNTLTLLKKSDTVKLDNGVYSHQ